ncbi:MAG: T9SS type A sorting domain-containing protein, partial [Saprospiraceae bacterium]
VELRVTWDANNNERVDEGELSNICWTYINIEDKTPPELSANNGSFFCDDPEFERVILFTGEYAFNSDILFPSVVGGCSSEDVRLRIIDIDFSNYDPVCRVGTITRDFVAFRNSVHGNIFSQPVSQTISILFRSDWTMKFPADVMVQCEPAVDDNLGGIPAPLRIGEILTNRACDQWGMETKDEIFDVVGVDGSGACFKVIRTYKFINWCTWDPTNTEIGIVPRPLDFFEDPALCVTLDYQSDAVANICALQNKIDDGLERFNDPYDLLFGNNGNPFVDLISELDADFIYIDEDYNTGGDDIFGTGDCIDNGFNSIFGTAIDFAPQTANYLIDDNQNHNFVSAEAYGYFIYRQVIKVVDNVAPVFVQIEDVEVCDITDDCGVNYKLPIPEVMDCKNEYTLTYSVDINGDGDTNDGNENGRILGNPIDGFTTPLLNTLSLGTHTITYLANDGCGNIGKMEFDVIIKDCKAPTAYCRGIILELMPTGMVELWANDLDAGSFDNCSNPITFSFDAAGEEQARVFTCDNLGTNLLQLHVTDAVGNQSICETFVIIQSDNIALECPELVSPLLAGNVMTETGDEVPGSMISVNGSMEMEMMTTTGGTFSVEVEAGGDYSVSATKDVNPLNGVTTFDLVLMRKHVLGILPIDSPYKLIAADVNHSKAVTTLDMVMIRKLILGMETEFPQTESWRFIDAKHEFTDATNPWLTEFPEVVNINNLTEDMTTADFVAIKMGDVNNSAVPNYLASTDERSERELWNIKVDEMALTAAQTYEVPFYATDMDIEGYQFTLNFDVDKVNIVEIKDGSAKTENFGTNFLEDGQLTASWDGKLENADEPLFTLVLQSQHSANLSEVFTISSDFTRAEAYSFGNNIKNISLFFMFGTDIEDSYMLAQNKPNPFTNQTEIQFTLPKATAATLTVTDLAGKVVWKKTATYEAGLQSEIIEATELKTNGVFFYHLQADSFQATRRMIQLAK